MNLFAHVVLFVAILLFYLNLVRECKIGQDLDVYEWDYENTEKLYKVCGSKQPVVFRMDRGEVIPDSHYINTISPASLAETYGKEDVFLSTEHDDEPIPVPLQSAVLLLEDPSKQHLFENNHDLVMDLPIHHYFQSIDPFLRPFGCVQTEYDFAFGSTTRLRHHQHHSFFIYAVGGDLDVKLTPYKNVMSSGVENPYDGYVYPATAATHRLIDCWKEDDDEEDPEITFLNVSVPVGCCLFVPPYWWYSVRSVDGERGIGNGWMAVFKYDTLMGRVVYWSRQIKNNLLQWIRHGRENKKNRVLDEEEEDALVEDDNRLDLVETSE